MTLAALGPASLSSRLSSRKFLGLGLGFICARDQQWHSEPDPLGRFSSSRCRRGEEMSVNVLLEADGQSPVLFVGEEFLKTYEEASFSLENGRHSNPGIICPAR